MLGSAPEADQALARARRRVSAARAAAADSRARSSGPAPAYECGHVSAENGPTQEKFHCQSCGHTAHADTVGALNVLRAGPVRRQANPAQREIPGFIPGEESPTTPRQGADDQRQAAGHLRLVSAAPVP